MPHHVVMCLSIHKILEEVKILHMITQKDVQHGKKALMPYGNSKDPNEHAHLCSLIWTFTCHQQIEG